MMENNNDVVLYLLELKKKTGEINLFAATIKVVNIIIVVFNCLFGRKYQNFLKKIVDIFFSFKHFIKIIVKIINIGIAIKGT